MTTSLSSLLGVTPIAGTLPVAYGGTGLTVPGTTGNVLTSNGTSWSSQPAPVSLPTQTGNTGKYLITDGTTASWATVVGGLISTPTKTANYTAASNELVRVNATSSFNITLPASPTDGAIVGILDIANTFSANNITVLPGAGANIEGSVSVVLDVGDSYAEFTYIASINNWRLLNIPSGGVGGLQVTPIKTANYTAIVSELVRCDSTTSGFNITLPPSPSDGSVVGVFDVMSTFGTNNITVLPGAGNTVEGVESVILDISHTYAEFLYSSSNTNWVVKDTPSNSGDLSNAINAVGYSLKTATTEVNVSSSPAPSTGQVLTATSSTAATWQTVNGLPTQSGNTGKYLTTDGSAASWSTVSALPLQTGNTGKYLTTDGTTASWGTVGGGGVTLSDDTSTTNTSYLTMARATSGSVSTVYTSSTKLYFNPSTGTLSATNFNTVSDQNKKTNITPVSGLNVVNQLRGVEFDFIESGQHSSGVIAQELEKVLPFLVTESDGTKTVNYSGIIAYLISSINELEQRLKAVEG